MKKTLFSIALLAITAISIHAQNAYTDILAEGKTWEFVKWPAGNTISMMIRGDTIIDGLACKRYGVPGADGSFTCLAAFRQEGPVVYRHDPATERFVPAFNFEAFPGDTMEWDESIFHIRLKVTDVGAVTVRGNVLRKVDYEAAWSEPGGASGTTSGRWIEGVGGNDGPMATALPVVGSNNALLGVSLDGTSLCDREVFNPGEYDKRMLTYAPVWVWRPLRWDAASGTWEEDGEELAWKTGVKVTSMGLFVYTTVACGADGGSTLLLRESAGKVYAQRDSYLDYVCKALPEAKTPYETPGEWSEDVLLYDFTLGAGDKYPCFGDVTVEAVSSVTPRDGVERKVLHLSNGLLVVEGIGCVNAPVGVFAYQNYEAESQASPIESESMPALTLQSFAKYKGEAPLYTLGDSLLGISISRIDQKSDNSTYDLQGRRLQAPPARGVYIRGGRKYVK